MVSNALNMDLQQLLGILEHIRNNLSRSAEYKEFRQELPADWPM
jgi:hypothetical protein